MHAFFVHAFCCCVGAGQREYSTPVDVWSCGCIMAELLAKAPLFPGQNEVGQLDQIFKTLGVPNEDTWSGVTQLPNFRRFNFKGSSKSVLRGKFPPPGPVFDGRPTLSDAGFDLLKGLLDMCPVSSDVQHLCNRTSRYFGYQCLLY